MVRKRGYMLITVPNTRNLHGLLMRLFCPDVLKVHRDALMHRSVLSGLAEELGFEVLYCDYLATFRPFYPLPRMVALGARVVNKALRLAKLNRLPNAFASPYLYLIARRAN